MPAYDASKESDDEYEEDTILRTLKTVNQKKFKEKQQLNNHHQRGSIFLPAIIAIAVLVLMGTGSVVVYQTHKTNNTGQKNSVNTPSRVTAVPEVLGEKDVAIMSPTPTAKPKLKVKTVTTTTHKIVLATATPRPSSKPTPKVSPTKKPTPKPTPTPAEEESSEPEENKEQPEEESNKTEESKTLSFVYPVASEFQIASHFGDPGINNTTNQGIDFAIPIGTPVYASEAGKVVSIRKDTYSYIMISHGNNLLTFYGALSEIRVEKDQEVAKGQQIGLSGKSMVAPIVHFEIRKMTEDIPVMVDPLLYLGQR